ncbi:TIGR03936 family radical SAM-associated protein [Athalassotoga saccharophila]|uniref:TIGR03936 family radical SAM-associated protein n=1 Tax=Athalassotoga saccharophila TaxID=1441386 RepID=UPI001379FBE8|nr:TIGR03936 family radical SAM-associated protein [Athalassotoga saccharophila]BBJ27930.1 hypothetical protein ATHSA_0824 [Athalassotoga saccharophila]
MKYLFFYKRYGLLRFLSNHETMRMIERILRRTGMNLKMTEGFHQRLKLSFGQALPTGIIDRAGLFLISTDEEIGQEFIGKINSLSPHGFEVYRICKVSEKFELGRSVNGYVFSLIFLEEPNIPEGWKIEKYGKIWKTSFFVAFNSSSPRTNAYGQYLTLRESVVFKETFNDESACCG